MNRCGKITKRRLTVGKSKTFRNDKNRFRNKGEIIIDNIDNGDGDFNSVSGPFIYVRYPIRTVFRDDSDDKLVEQLIAIP